MVKRSGKALGLTRMSTYKPPVRHRNATSVERTRGLLSITILLSLTACATTSAPPSPWPLPDTAPSVESVAGSRAETFELVRGVAGGSTPVKVIVDADLRAHVIVAAKSLHSAEHILVGPRGILARETIASGVSPKSVDAAIDGMGNLHVLLDANHYVLQGGTWQNDTRTPWQRIGIKPSFVRFVADASDLTWMFIARGKEIGSAGRWDWHILGGGAGSGPGYGFLIWPWRSHPQKLVIVPDNQSNSHGWIGLDLEDKAKFEYLHSASADPNSDHVELFYSVDDIHGTKYRFARVPLHQKDEDTANPISPNVSRLPRLRPAAGTNIRLPSRSVSLEAVSRGRSGWFAVFWRPHERNPYATYRWLDPNWSAPTIMSVTGFHKLDLVHARDDKFHLLMTGSPQKSFWSLENYPIEYLSVSTGIQTRPEVVGLSPSGISTMGSGKDGRAFSVWWTRDGLVGRWIAEPTDGANVP